MNKYKKLGKNILLLTIGNFVSKALSFFLVPLYTAVLTTSEYGTADLITTGVNLIMPIFTCLIYEAVLRFTLDQNEDKNQIFTIGFGITVLGSIIVTILSQLLKVSDVFADYIWMFNLYYISTAFYNLLLQFAKGKEYVHVYALAGVLNTFIYIISNIVLILVLKMGVYGYLLSFIIGHMVTSIYVFIAIKAYENIVFCNKIEYSKIHSMLKYSLPMIPNSISWWVSNSSDKYILLFFCGTAVNGIYSVAYKIPSILTIVVSIFISAWQISSIEEFGSEASKKFYTEIYTKYEALLVIIASVLIALTRIIARFLYSADFYEAWLFTPVLILASVFNSTAAFYGSIYTAAKSTKMLFYSTIMGAIGNIVLNLLLIPKLGAMGAAIATMVSYLVVWVVRIIDTKKILYIDFNYKKSIIIYSLILIEIILVSSEKNELKPVVPICVLLICFLYRKMIYEAFLISKKIVYDFIKKVIQK